MASKKKAKILNNPSRSVVQQVDVNKTPAPRKVGSLVASVFPVAKSDLGIGVVISWKYLTYMSIDPETKVIAYKVYWAGLNKVESHYESELEDV